MNKLKIYSRVIQKLLAEYDKMANTQVAANREILASDRACCCSNFRAISANGT